MNKRGIFFSIMSILFIVVFYLLLKVKSDTLILDSEMQVTRARVDNLNSIVNDMGDRYLEEILLVASKNALMMMSDYAANGPSAGQAATSPYWNNAAGGFLGYNDFHRNFNNSLCEGLVQSGSAQVLFKDNANYGIGSPPMLLPNLINNLRTEFSYLGIVTDRLDVDVTSIRQKDPWTIRVAADIYYSIKDERKIASWKGKTHKEVDISIIGLYDPIAKTKITNSYRIDTYSDCNSFPGDRCEASGPPLSPSYCDWMNSPSYINKLKGRKFGDAQPDDIGLAICNPSIQDCNPVCP